MAIMYNYSIHFNNINMRTKVLDLSKFIRIGKETHTQLRVLKRKQRKSMAQIMKDLVEIEFNKITK